jgi:hypothetical protein
MKIIFVCGLLALPVLGGTHTQAPATPPWKLIATRDSFVVNVNGQPMGAIVFVVERLERGIRVTENTRIGTFVEQTTEILLDAEQRLLSVVQVGKMRGQEARIELRYDKGRVKGHAQIPGPQGQISHNIDSAVPADVVDDNLMQGVIAALPWSADASYSLPVFSAGKNALSERKLAVVETTADAYKVRMGDKDDIVHVYVSRSSPQRILRIAPAGSPMEMVRVN